MTQIIKYYTPKELGIEDEDEFIYDPTFDGFSFVTEETITGQGRWSTFYERVAQRLSDNTYWCFNWQGGSTEYQETEAGLQAHQVEPVKVTRTEYKPVKTS